jgi:hypothetical protein
MAFPGGAQIAVIRHGPNVPLPSMQLDFLNNTSLNSRITFSRGTNATLVDSTGRITYAPANLLLQSEGTVAQLAASSNVTDASVTISGYANSIQFSDNSVTRFAYKTLTIAAGVSLIASFVVQMDDNSAPSVGTGITGGDFSIICDGGYAPVVSSALISGNIYRVWGILSSPTGGTFRNVGIIKNTGQSTKGFRVTGFQLEQVTYQTAPGTYVATTASAYYGPRFDYDPVTLAPRGLLIEEARTNLLLQSETFDNASWPKTDATVTANVTNAPSGTAVADKLAETATTAAHSVSQIVTIAIGTSYTYTVYAKAAERNWIALQFTGGMTANHGAYFDLANGVVGSLINSPASASITKLADGWYRCSITSAPATGTSTTAWVYTASGNNVVSYLGTAGSGVYLWGAQFEAGAFATSYIPTVASTVSRSADVAFMSGTNFSSWFNAAQGTFVSSVSSNANASCVLVVSDNTVSNQLFMISTADNILSVYTGGAFQAMLGVTPAAPYVNAGAYATNDFAACSNGGTLSTDTSGSLAGSYARMSIGSNFSGTGVFLNGRIRAIAYYNTRLPNTQLQTLTAPSLASPLALDFISPTYTVGY